MRVNFPPTPDRYDSTYYSRAFAEITKALEFALSKTEASDSVLLLSPGGFVYKVTVADNGTLTTTSVPLGRSGATNF